MADEQFITIQIPVSAREALREIAEFYRRSSTAQAAWMFEQELIDVREKKAVLKALKDQLPLPIEPTAQ